jgi:hypothetical protein
MFGSDILLFTLQTKPKLKIISSIQTDVLKKEKEATKKNNAHFRNLFSNNIFVILNCQ